MSQRQFIDLCVADIMTRWPATIGVFIDLGMHCVGCPIATFHTLVEAAEEHGLPLDHLTGEIEAAIAGRRIREGRERDRHRSAAIGGGP